MSTRLYPVYKKGSEQLRVFLPNFFMKLVKPEIETLPNQARFIVSSEMTSADVKNYLEKIYKIEVVHVRTYNAMGKTRLTEKKYVVKDDDYKVAFVTMPKHVNFKFPDLFPQEKLKENMEKEMKELNQMKKAYADKVRANESRRGVPSWFGI